MNKPEMTFAQYRNEQQWMLREDAWALLVGVLAELRENLDDYMFFHAEELVEEVGGSAELAPRLADMLLLNVINPAFNDLAVLVRDQMEVRMAHPGGEDVELHVMFAEGVERKGVQYKGLLNHPRSANSLKLRSFVA